MKNEKLLLYNLNSVSEKAWLAYLSPSILPSATVVEHNPFKNCWHLYPTCIRLHPLALPIPDHSQGHF